MLPMIFILLLVTNYVANQAVYVASQGVTPSIHREALHRQAQVAVVPDNAFGIASSNRCWASATTLLVTEDHNVNENIDLMSFCSNMPDDVRKMLALEITKCHMHDVGLPVFIEDERDANICHEQINDSTLYVCMKRLTPSGAQLLAIFSNSVHATCTRVIGDHFLKVNRERYNELTHQFAKLSAYTSRVEQALDEALDLEKLQRKSILNMPSKIVELVSNMTRNVVTDKIEIAFKEILKSELDISMWGLGVNISTMAGIQITTMLEEFFTQIENMQKKLNEGASRAKTFASSELKQLREEHLPFLDDVKEFVSLAKTLAGSVEYFKNKYKDLQESFFTETKNLMDEVIELASRVKTSGPAEYLKNKYKDLLTLLGNIKRLLNPETYIPYKYTLEMAFDVLSFIFISFCRVILIKMISILPGHTEKIRSILYQLLALSISIELVIYVSSHFGKISKKQLYLDKSRKYSFLLSLLVGIGYWIILTVKPAIKSFYRFFEMILKGITSTFLFLRAKFEKFNNIPNVVNIPNDVNDAGTLPNTDNVAVSTVSSDLDESTSESLDLFDENNSIQSKLSYLEKRKKTSSIRKHKRV